MVYACYSIFNEEQFLRLSLQSIVDHVDKVIIVDGAWKTYPTTEFYSTDKSKAIAEEVCGRKLIWVDAPEEGWNSQLDKRNEYVKRVPNDKWFLIIDGDEIIIGDIDEQFKKLENNDELHMCLIPVSFHTPYLNTSSIPMRNEIGGYRDSTNENAKILINNINEESFKTMPWISIIGHRYAMYKKEKGMHYQQHHSLLWIDDTKIFHKYGGIYKPSNLTENKNIYLMENVVIDDLKYIRKFDRWKTNMIEKTQRVIREKNETYVSDWLIEIEKYRREKKFKRSQINPIMIIRSPRDNPDIEENFKKITSMDKLWIKHYPIFTANQKLLDWVMRNHKDYTHVIMTTDDVVVSNENIEQLMEDLQTYDFPILTGICNFCHVWMGSKQGSCCLCNEGKPHEYLSATFTPLNDIKNAGKYLHDTKTPALSRDTYDFIPDTFRHENPIIKKIFFHGIALTAIRMDIFLELEGLHLYNREKGISADDVNLAIECHNRKIPQHADFKVFVQHMGGIDIYPKINVRSNSKIVFQPKDNGPVVEILEKSDLIEPLTKEQEFNKFKEGLRKFNITIPSRPHFPIGETVYDNITKRNLDQKEWDELYGKWREFIK